MQVRSEMCATCIFRPGNQMRLRKGRVAEMVRECAERQTYIPCHESMRPVGESDPDGDPEMDGPVCRGFFDSHGHVSQMVRIAERLGVLEEVAS